MDTNWSHHIENIKNIDIAWDKKSEATFSAVDPGTVSG